MQNLAPGGFSVPQLVQRGESSPPQETQKRARSGFSAAHVGHIRVSAITGLNDTGACATLAHAYAPEARRPPS
jgi:hypothetical protein